MTTDLDNPSPQIHTFDATDASQFRRALGCFASGIVVITAIADEPVGMTCQSFTSLSLDPPLVLFSAAATSTTFPRIQQASRLCINVLAEGQDWLSGQFGRSGGDKWQDVSWTAGQNGAPRIDGAAMWCEGTLRAVHEGGDHEIAVVEVTTLATTADTLSPLIFHEGHYARICTWPRPVS